MQNIKIRLVAEDMSKYPAITVKWRVLPSLNSAICVSYRSLSSNIGTLHDVAFANFWFRQEIFLGLCIDLELHELAVENTRVDIREWRIFDTNASLFLLHIERGMLENVTWLRHSGYSWRKSRQNDGGCHFKETEDEKESTWSKVGSERFEDRRD